MARMLLSCLLASLLGCTSAQEPQSPSDSGNSASAAGPSGIETSVGATRGESPVRLARLPHSPVGDTATDSGILAAEGPCLYLLTGNRRFLLAIAVPGATWDASARALRVPGGRRDRRFSLGTRVTVGGSQASSAALADDWIDPPSAGCDTDSIWVAHSIAEGMPEG